MIHPKECASCGHTASEYGDFTDESSGTVYTNVPMCDACLDDERPELLQCCEPSDCDCPDNCQCDDTCSCETCR